MTGRLLNLAGFPGRFFISWLRRLQEQLAFAGRLCLTGLGSQARQGGRPLILRRLFLEEVWRLFFTTGGMIVLTGLMSGILWDTIWFGVLDNIGGAETLITLTFSIQLQEVTPILGAAVVTMGHGVPMTVDLSLRKSQGEFTTFSALGLPPELYLAWPRLLGGLAGFPILMGLMAVSTLTGLYLGIWHSIELPLGDFLAAAKTCLVSFYFLKMGAKCLIAGFCLNFFCLYHSWRIEEDSLMSIPRRTRWAMAEAFIYCIAGLVMVTALYD